MSTTAITIRVDTEVAKAFVDASIVHPFGFGQANRTVHKPRSASTDGYQSSVNFLLDMLVATTMMMAFHNSYTSLNKIKISASRS